MAAVWMLLSFASVILAIVKLSVITSCVVGRSDYCFANVILAIVKHCVITGCVVGRSDLRLSAAFLRAGEGNMASTTQATMIYHT